MIQQESCFEPRRRRLTELKPRLSCSFVLIGSRSRSLRHLDFCSCERGSLEEGVCRLFGRYYPHRLLESQYSNATSLADLFRFSSSASLSSSIGSSIRIASLLVVPLPCITGRVVIGRILVVVSSSQRIHCCALMRVREVRQGIYI